MHLDRIWQWKNRQKSALGLRKAFSDFTFWNNFRTVCPRVSKETVQKDLSSKRLDMSNVPAGQSPRGQAILRTSSGKKRIRHRRHQMRTLDLISFNKIDVKKFTKHSKINWIYTSTFTEKYPDTLNMDWNKPSDPWVLSTGFVWDWILYRLFICG